MIKIVPLLFIGTLLFFTCPTVAQTQGLTLEECYRLAEQHYPLTKQRALISKSKAYTIQNISKGYLPQLHFHAQATYQSDVPEIPLHVPGIEIPVLSKDQYRFYGEVNQTLYDGGKLKNEKKKAEAESQAQAQKLAVALYDLKGRINQLFFGILLVDEQLKQNELHKRDIALGIKNTQALVRNGVAFKSSVDVLRAAFLKANQQTITLQAQRKSYAEMLGLFINVPVTARTALMKPEFSATAQEINRPELQLYHDQVQVLNVQAKMLRVKNRPKLNLFLQGGYGRPAFDLFDNSFDSFYIGGLRLQIPLMGLYTLRNDKALIGLEKAHIQVRKETFLFNTNLALSQQETEISKLKALLESDEKILALRESIKATAAVQLKNGVITTHDFLEEVNAENGARQSKVLHEIQLLMAQYDQKITSGN